MSKKMKKELMALDFYEILGLSMGADEQEVRKAYRKKALKCHPDKNPDNKDAAEEFDRLKKILEILLDAGTRKAYDKVLRGRKAAAVRAREADARTQKLRTDLETRERQAAEQREARLSEEEKLRREIRRLEEEGQRLIDEELDRVNQQVEQELSAGTGKKKPEPPPGKRSHKVKVKWLITDDWPGYTEEEVRRLFHKWGDINALVIKQRSKKGTALIDFATKSGADMAVQFEKGMLGKLMEVTHVSDEPPTRKADRHHENTEKTKEAGDDRKKYDFETIADMNRRRAEERRKLIEEIMKEEAGKK